MTLSQLNDKDISSAQDEAEYRVVRLKVDDDYTRIYVADNEMETAFVIMTSDYFDLKIYQDQIIDQKMYYQLTRLHGFAYGYRRAIRALRYKDHSVKEISDLLYGIQNLDSRGRKRIMEQLTESGLLNDEQLVQNEIENDRMKLVGHHKTAGNLSRRGIDLELIDKYISEIDPEEECQRGIEKAAGIVKTIRNRSYRETVNVLKSRLRSAGYPGAMIPEIVAALQLEPDEDREQDNLNRQFEKARRRYQNRYSGSKLKNRIYQSLYSKGYRSEDIRILLETIREEDNED